MITYNFEDIAPIHIPSKYSEWLEMLISSEQKKPGNINYIICSDQYLIKINQDFLQHDYYTDIITFDYVKGKTISADIFISLQRVLDNASNLNRDPDDELRRVLAHGLLHLCGYKDKTDQEQELMRSKEDYYLSLY